MKWATLRDLRIQLVSLTGDGTSTEYVLPSDFLHEPLGGERRMLD